jgi:secreted trypsin-like serine protease
MVELNGDSTIPVVDDVVTVIGFGTTMDGGDPSNVLLTVTVDIYSDDVCLDLYHVFVPETMICAGTTEGGRDSCQGDIGGPLLLANNHSSNNNNILQVGIVSKGNGCGRPNIPAIYTKVAAFQSFIRQGICGMYTNFFSCNNSS